MSDTDETSQPKNSIEMDQAAATKILLQLMLQDSLTEQQKLAIQTIVTELIERNKSQSFKKFALDEDWLQGAFEGVEDICASADYFFRYFEGFCNRLNGEQLLKVNSILKHFILDTVDVHFCPRDQLPHKLIQTQYGCSTVTILVPEDAAQSMEERERIRDYYQGLYLNRLQEGQVRMNALLWYALPAHKKSEIRAGFLQVHD